MRLLVYNTEGKRLGKLSTHHQLVIGLKTVMTTRPTSNFLFFIILVFAQ